jgi:predicted amidophosphoribosyltransferase
MSWTNSVRAFSRVFINFLFPQTPQVLRLESLSSEKLRELLTESELNGGKDEVWALFDYAHPLTKEIIWEIKYKGNKTLADKMGEILFDILEAELAEAHIYEKFGHILIIPVPISDKRQVRTRLESGRARRSSTQTTR